MRDKRYFELRSLTEDIFDIRKNIMGRLDDPLSEEYMELEAYYNELCQRREELEREIFKEDNEYQTK